MLKQNKNRHDDLFSAAKYGDIGEVLRLIEAGHSVKAADLEGYTALHYAAEFSVGSIQYYKDMQLTEGNYYEIPPEMREPSYYFSNNAFKYAKNYGGREMIDALLKAGADINAKDNYGQTPLHCAAKFQSNKNVSFLLNKNAEINVQNKRGETPLHIAAKYGQYEHSSSDILLYSNDKNVKALIEAGADVNIKTMDGNTALHYAAMHVSSSRVKALVGAGAEVNIKNLSGDTPFDRAAQYDPKFSSLSPKQKIIVKNIQLQEDCIKTLRDLSGKLSENYEMFHSADDASQSTQDIIDYMSGELHNIFYEG